MVTINQDKDIAATPQSYLNKKRKKNQSMVKFLENY